MADSQSRDWEQLINPSLKQTEFIEKAFRYDYTLYGGAAGGGKSYVLRWFLVLFLHWLYTALGIRNAQVGIFTEDYPTLWDRQISKMQAEFPPWLGSFHLADTKHFRLHRQFGGGFLALRNLDDPSKYQSAEFAAIGVDELTKNKKSVFDFLRFRLRWPGVDHPKFVAGTNPGGAGHEWVKKLWLEHEFPVEMESLREQFAFVQAKASDNPHLSDSYYDSLLTLPPDMAKAFADGDWNIFPNQYYDIWNESKMVVRAETLSFKPWWPRWISIDWGFAHNLCVHWWTATPPDEHGKRTVYTYREWVTKGITPKDIGRIVCQKSQYRDSEELKFENIDAIYMDAPRDKRTDEDTITEQIHKALRENGLAITPDFPDKDREGGWMLMYELLRDGLWKVCDSCPELMRAIPSLTRDPDFIEDVLKSDSIADDVADCARYGLKSRLKNWKKQAPLEERVLARVTATDPTSRAIQIKKVLLDEKKRSKPLPIIGHSRFRAGLQR